MDLANYEGYRKHSKQMSYRVRKRASHPELTAIDNKVIDIIKSLLDTKKEIKILDTGCGTGERYHMILKRGKIDIKRIKAQGIDFCEPLVKEAKKKKISGKPLYEKVQKVDLSQDFELEEKFDLIICLFSVLNNVGKNYRKTLKNLERHLSHVGILIFDILHPETKEHLFAERLPELEQSYGKPDKDEFYYTRKSDGSWGKVYLFPPQDFIDGLKLKDTELTIKKIIDVSNFKTKKGKFSKLTEYEVKDTFSEPDKLNAWKNSVLVITKNEK